MNRGVVLIISESCIVLWMTVRGPHIGCTLCDIVDNNTGLIGDTHGMVIWT